MTELYLNNRLVQLAEKTSFKVKMENVYFSDSDKYTFEIAIPIAGNTNNILIFGNINRLDVGKTFKTMTARLIADNRVLLNGTATVVSFTHETITVQLLAGLSELNFLEKYNDSYIDELDLGEITPENEAGDYTDTARIFLDIADIDDESERMKKLFGQYPDTEYVCFPIYSDTAEVLYNPLAIRATAHKVTTIFLPHRKYGTTMLEDGKLPIKNFPTDVKCAPQPYFCVMINRIFNAYGYTVTQNDIENSVLKNVFIANATPTLKFAEMLPHWTFADFRTEVEHFFGVVFDFDDVAKEVRILSRENQFDYTGDAFLDEVFDDFKGELDEEETTDISNANIGYEFETVDEYLKFADNVLEAAQLVQFETSAELYKYYQSLSESEAGKYIFEANGIQYIALTDSKGLVTLTQANQFRNLIRNEETTDVQIGLKIVPGTLFETTINKEVTTDGYLTDDRLLVEAKKADTWCLVGTGSSIVDEEYSLQEVIDGDAETTSKPDVIEVAFNDGIMQLAQLSGKDEYYDFPFPCILGYRNTFLENDRGFSFELNERNKATYPTMYSTVFGVVSKINTQSEIVFKFRTKNIYRPTQRFVIRNKVYVCRMIELTVTEEGISEEKTGYFYEYEG